MSTIGLNRVNTTVPAGTGTGTGTTSVTLTYPTNFEGECLTLFVVVRPNTAALPSLANWTLQNETTGGFGVQGIDTGLVRAGIYTRVAGSTPPTGSLVITPTSSPNAVWAWMIAQPALTGATSVWSFASAIGSDNTTGAAYSATMGAGIDIASGDFLYALVGCSSDGTTWSGPTMTASGLTPGTGIELAEPKTTQGNDLGGFVARWQPTAGSTSSAATITATGATDTANCGGPCVLLRLRETSSTDTAIAPDDTAVLDDFNRADVVLTSGNWAQLITSGSTLQIASNVVRSTTAFGNGYWVPSTFGPDCYAGITVTTKGDDFIEIYLRVADPGGSGIIDAYDCQVEGIAAASDRWTLTKVVNNVFSDIKAFVALPEFATNDKVAGWCRNNIVAIWHKPSAGSWTVISFVPDTTFTAAGYIGLELEGTVTRVDNFFGGTLASGGSDVPSSRRAMRTLLVR